jgi:hypothetical protein
MPMKVLAQMETQIALLITFYERYALTLLSSRKDLQIHPYQQLLQVL